MNETTMRAGAVPARHLEILQHALGVDGYGRGRQYRNHFVPGGDDYAACMELAAAGLMRNRGSSALTGGSDCFTVTEEGKRAMAEQSPKPPKVSAGRRRYLDFLNADCGMSFIDFLRAQAQMRKDPASSCGLRRDKGGVS